MELTEATIDEIALAVNEAVDTAVLKDLPQAIDFVYTLKEDDILLGVGGLKLLNHTTAWCWVIWTKNALKYKTISYRVIKSFLDEFAQNKKIKRLMAATRTDFPEAINLVRHLGFHRESVMKKFFGDKDAYLYVRTW